DSIEQRCARRPVPALIGAMKTDEAAHRARPWRVHAIAADFDLEDLWAFDLGDRATADVREFLACFWDIFHELEKGWLARTRVRVGRALGWDDRDFALPIPGCTEKSVTERLTEDAKRGNLAPPDAPSPVETPQVKTAYIFPDEALYEFSNDTIHGMLHIGLV